MFLLQVTFGSLIVTLQPLLVGNVDFNLVYMSLFILTIAFTSLVPSIAIAILSKRGVADRYLMVAGTVAMISVSFLYSAPPMHGWQTIAGGVLIIPGACVYVWCLFVFCLFLLFLFLLASAFLCRYECVVCMFVCIMSVYLCVCVCACE
jgi:hypothetical protein